MSDELLLKLLFEVYVTLGTDAFRASKQAALLAVSHSLIVVVEVVLVALAAIVPALSMNVLSHIGHWMILSTRYLLGLLNLAGKV